MPGHLGCPDCTMRGVSIMRQLFLGLGFSATCKELWQCNRSEFEISLAV